jgi:hypothetical protein
MPQRLPCLGQIVMVRLVDGIGKGFAQAMRAKLALQLQGIKDRIQDAPGGLTGDRA